MRVFYALAAQLSIFKGDKNSRQKETTQERGL